MNNYECNIGERIRLIRQYFQLTQQQFAKQLGVSRSHISNIENGNETPSNSLVLFISTIFPINRDWLMYEEGDMLVSGAARMLNTESIRLDRAVENLTNLFRTTEYCMKDYLMDLLDKEIDLAHNCFKTSDDTAIVMTDIVNELCKIVITKNTEERKNAKYNLFRLIDELDSINE